MTFQTPGRHSGNQRSCQRLPDHRGFHEDFVLEWPGSPINFDGGRSRTSTGQLRSTSTESLFSVIGRIEVCKYVRVYGARNSEENFHCGTLVCLHDGLNEFMVWPHRLQGMRMALLISRYAIIDFEVCHH